MKRLEKKVKGTGIILCEGFALSTIFMLLATKQYDRLLLAVTTILLVLLPLLMEHICHCRICLPVYLFGLLYSIGPMLGQCWNFYYTVSWWDKLLHICGGVMFAIVGVYFFELLTRQRENRWAAVIFALCFSVALAAVWEFVEFGADHFLGMDMQDDMVITSIRSHLLNEGLGETGSIENIHAVTINGAPLPVDGYIDIGLTDTMLDMLLESLGALIACLLILLDKDRHPLIAAVENSEEQK